VERHAQVDEAELLAHRDESGRSVVELRDRGKGFDPARIPAQRRGIDSSIIGRMSSTGGSVSVDSRPGEGTTVRWVWSDAPA
jgi:signal transduction histidine kinase